ncbi:coiled-coil domain-containing protein 125 [Ctenodactylus gundi]
MSKVVRSLSDSEVQTWETEDDDMTDGDLGYGLGRRPGGLCGLEVSHVRTSRRRSDGERVSPHPCPGCGGEGSGATGWYFRQKSLQSPHHRGSGVPHSRQQSHPDSNSELSKEDLTRRLHETLEEVEILKTELEASQRQLESKEEALKILQSMAVLEKATSHTQAVLQKTVEQKRSLEKEINALQWEIEFDQNRFKNIEESWIQKYDRVNCENAVLKENLKLKTEEIKMLKSENGALSQQYLEALAVLDVRQQQMAQESPGRVPRAVADAAGVELAVLGACLCRGPGGSPCACARMAASARKLVLQLKHERERLRRSRDEADLRADACRAAFEQQLVRTSHQALRWMRGATSRRDWRRPAQAEHSFQKGKKTLVQKLLGVLPSEARARSMGDQGGPREAIGVLVDLLNDKEEALAHQRKVSYMLARALEDRDTAVKQNADRSDHRMVNSHPMGHALLTLGLQEVGLCHGICKQKCLAVRFSKCVQANCHTTALPYYYNSEN